MQRVGYSLFMGRNRGRLLCGTFMLHFEVSNAEEERSQTKQRTENGLLDFQHKKLNCPSPLPRQLSEDLVTSPEHQQSVSSVLAMQASPILNDPTPREPGVKYGLDPIIIFQEVS